MVETLTAATMRAWRGATFFGFLMLSLAWSLATPLFSGPDEADHVSWAAAVSRFDLHPTEFRKGDGGVVTVPAAFASGRTSAKCFLLHPDVSARCATPIPSRG
jgi:hypothetical protein